MVQAAVLKAGQCRQLLRATQATSRDPKRDATSAGDATTERAVVGAGPHVWRQLDFPPAFLIVAGTRESGITKQTFYTWGRQLRNQGTPVPGSGESAEEWTSEDKFAVVLETAALNAIDLAEYCPRKGLFAEQIATWKAACMAANASAPQQVCNQQAQSLEDKKRIRELKAELQRKEGAG